MKDNQNGLHTPDKTGKQPNPKPAEKSGKRETALEGPNVKKGKQNQEESEEETTDSKTKGNASAKHQPKKEVL